MSLRERMQGTESDTGKRDRFREVWSVDQPLPSRRAAGRTSAQGG